MTKILIVDDDITTCMMIEKLLQANDYSTCVAHDGATALLLAHSEVPDLIIMDLRMPVLEGGDAIVALRKQVKTEDIPIIALSAVDDDRTLMNTLNQGANMYINKPFNVHELLAVVDRLSRMPKDKE